MSEGPTGSDPGRRESDLSGLRSRLAELQGSVERLGRDDAGASVPPPPAPPTPPEPHAYGGTAAGVPSGPPPYTPPPVEPSQAPAAEPDWGYNPYAEPVPPAPPAQVDAYGHPVEPEPEPYQPAPAATNGQGEAEAGAAAIEANIAILDIGPFHDLIELRHFEEAVIRLEAVRDVRVRRFGHSRAIVELGLAGPYAIGRELFRLGRPIQVEPGPEGEIIVDFTDIPEEMVPEPEAAAPAATEGAEAEVAETEAAIGNDEERG
jgi:hypothetical protein